MTEPNTVASSPTKIHELIFAKQRNGPTGVIKLIWDQNSTCFRSYSPMSAPSGVEYRSFEPRGARFDGGPDDLPT